MANQKHLDEVYELLGSKSGCIRYQTAQISCIWVSS